MCFAQRTGARHSLGGGPEPPLATNGTRERHALNLNRPGANAAMVSMTGAKPRALDLPDYLNIETRIADGGALVRAEAGFDAKSTIVFTRLSVPSRTEILTSVLEGGYASCEFDSAHNVLRSAGGDRFGGGATM